MLHSFLTILLLLSVVSCKKSENKKASDSPATENEKPGACDGKLAKVEACGNGAWVKWCFTGIDGKAVWDEFSIDGACNLTIACIKDRIYVEDAQYGLPEDTSTWSKDQLLGSVDRCIEVRDYLKEDYKQFSN